MLSAGPDAHRFSPSQNIRVKKTNAPRFGNLDYRHIASMRSQSRVAGVWELAPGDEAMMGQAKHILVVDDNGDVRDVIVASLQSHNYRVSSAPGGSVMRDFLKTGDTVDCAILDALMPGEASASLALHLKECGISLVMTSGSPDAMKYAMDNGLQLLRKPFHLQELYSAVTTALASGQFGQRSQDDG